jgi:hypothetical protein
MGEIMNCYFPDKEGVCMDASICTKYSCSWRGSSNLQREFKRIDAAIEKAEQILIKETILGHDGWYYLKGTYAFGPFATHEEAEKGKERKVS